MRANEIGLASKRCLCCGNDMSFDLFHKNKSKKNGFDSHCKICVGKKKQKRRRTRRKESKKLTNFDIQFNQEPDALTFAEAFRVLMGD